MTDNTLAKTPLCELAVRHGTDKYSKHYYTPHYYRMFKDRIQSVRCLLEIGIGNDKGDLRRHAGSLKMWEEFFPNAQIVGLDKKAHLLIDQGRITSMLADQDDTSSIKAAAMLAGPLDIVIDDGSHLWQHQVSSALTLLPFVTYGGIYVIEDVGNPMVLDEVRKYHGNAERIQGNAVYTDSTLVVIRK